MSGRPLIKADMLVFGLEHESEILKFFALIVKAMYLVLD